MVRLLFLLTCVGYCAVVGYAFWTFPDQVPVQVDGIGPGADTQPKARAAAAMLGIGLVLMVLFELMIRVHTRKALETVNLPHRDFWLRPEHRAEFRDRVRADLSFLGACTLTLLGGVILLTGHALDRPGDNSLGAGALILLLAFAAATLGYVVFMYTVRYRPRPSLKR